MRECERWRRVKERGGCGDHYNKLQTYSHRYFTIPRGFDTKHECFSKASLHLTITFKKLKDSYLISFFSMAKAFTVRTLPKDSSATAKAVANCSCASRDIFLKTDPSNVPHMITLGTRLPINRVSFGEIIKRVTTQPTV